MVPALVEGAALTQHVAQTASLAAALATSSIAASSYSSHGFVHIPAACCIAGGALTTVAFGARLAFRLHSGSLSRVFGAFLLTCGPAVPLMHMPEVASVRERIAPHLAAQDAWVPMALWGAIGGVAGFSSGLLGVGGGALITPMLALLTDLPQYTVLGTSLCAMLLPSTVSFMAHCRKGAFRLGVAAPLATGAAIGTMGGVSMAIHTDEQHLRWIFAAGLITIGLRMVMKR